MGSSDSRVQQPGEVTPSVPVVPVVGPELVELVRLVDVPRRELVVVLVLPVVPPPVQELVIPSPGTKVGDEVTPGI